MRYHTAAPGPAALHHVAGPSGDVPDVIPACFKCGGKGEVPVRPHGVAYCLSCWREALDTTVGTEAEPVPA